MANLGELHGDFSIAYGLRTYPSTSSAPAGSYTADAMVEP
jgi:hypothetical protein